MLPGTCQDRVKIRSTPRSPSSTPLSPSLMRRHETNRDCAKVKAPAHLASSGGRHSSVERSLIPISRIRRERSARNTACFVCLALASRLSGGMPASPQFWSRCSSRPYMWVRRHVECIAAGARSSSRFGDTVAMLRRQVKGPHVTPVRMQLTAPFPSERSATRAACMDCLLDLGQRYLPVSGTDSVSAASMAPEGLEGQSATDWPILAAVHLMARLG